MTWGRIFKITRHPTLLMDFIAGKSLNEIVEKYRDLEARSHLAETTRFIRLQKQMQNNFNNPTSPISMNKVCCIEDWNDPELKDIFMELSYRNALQLKRRKHWEHALGILCMNRLGKLNSKSKAVGIGVGKEAIPFYLANHIEHVYATDLYDGKIWASQAPEDFPEDPGKYAPFDYKKDALTALRMDGTKLEFPSDTFDIAFSFSSIEHFGGKNHSGALKSLKEIERVLKRGGIAVIATELIINGKKHVEFFNKKDIYSDLIDKLEVLKLVEPLDLTISPNTLDTVMDFKVAREWDNMDETYRENHPRILLRINDILFTSVMLVFQKDGS